MRTPVFSVGLVLFMGGVALFVYGINSAAVSCQDEDRGWLDFENRPRDEQGCYQSPGFIVAGTVIAPVGLIVCIVGLAMKDEPEPAPTPVFVPAPAPATPVYAHTPAAPGAAAPPAVPASAPPPPARDAGTRPPAPPAPGVRMDLCPFCGATRESATRRYCSQCGSELPVL